MIRKIILLVWVTYVRVSGVILHLQLHSYTTHKHTGKAVSQERASTTTSKDIVEHEVSLIPDERKLRQCSASR